MGQLKALAASRRGKILLALVGGVVLLVLYQLWREGRPIPFRIVVYEGILRGDHRMIPSISAITKHDDVDAFAQQVIGADSRYADQRQGFADQMRQLDYRQELVLVAFSGQAGGYDRFTIQQVTRSASRLMVHADFHTPGGWAGVVQQSIPIQRICWRSQTHSSIRHCVSSSCGMAGV